MNKSETRTVIKTGIVRSTTSHGELVKTYVYYCVEQHSILIKRYALATEMCAWEPVKKFKDKALFRESMHFKLDSLMAIQDCVNKFLSWNTKINQAQYAIKKDK